MKKLLLLTFVALLSACASLNPVAKPEVAITRINIGPSNGLQQQLLIGLQVSNPNSFALNLGKLRYQMDLAGSQLASILNIQQQAGEQPRNLPRVRFGTKSTYLRPW